MSYEELLQDVARYHHVHTAGFWVCPFAGPDLSPAAETALKELALRVTADLGVIDFVARQGLLYALRMRSSPLGTTLLRLAEQLR